MGIKKKNCFEKQFSHSYGGSLEARTPDPLIKSQPSRRSQLYKLLRNRLILLGFPGFIASQLFAKNHRFS
ncbi:MAG: hypothetical protein IKM88_05290, partial [Lachnospiraceae bacterium]|nr:hypothetical protein [Lachnospiraceae bacterium]